MYNNDNNYNYKENTRLTQKAKWAADEIMWPQWYHQDKKKYGAQKNKTESKANPGCR